MKKNTAETIGQTIVKSKKRNPAQSAARKVHTLPGDNTKYTTHALSLASLPKVDMTQVDQVEGRIMEYFRQCAEHDMKPSLAGLALAFGVTRKTLWAWQNGIDSAYVPSECRAAIEKAHILLNSLMEDYMQNGKINPVAGIFLMKNNMGYQDRQDVVVAPSDSLGEAASPKQLEAKYLADSSAE